MRILLLAIQPHSASTATGAAPGPGYLVNAPPQLPGVLSLAGSHIDSLYHTLSRYELYIGLTLTVLILTAVTRHLIRRGPG